MTNDSIPYWEKITILIHTKNRPWFLLRLIKYYNEKLGSVGINVIILDCSDDENFLIITKELHRLKHSLRIQVLHHSPSSSFSYRMAEALPLLSTPYVLLAADDDIYFFDWLKPGVDLLDCDSSFGIVYGHTLRFELEHYTPYGKLVRFDFSQPNPPARWLEGHTPLERLTELGRSDWTTMGWYALQRTEIFSIIVNNAKELSLDGYHFEIFLVFCQTALSKTRMLDYIYLARQINNDEKRPIYSFKAERGSLKKLMDVSAFILSQHKNIEMKLAISMVEDAFRAEIYALKKNDSRKYLRVIADYVPYLRELKSRFYCLMRRKRSGLDQFLPDKRFPSSPEIGSDHPRIKDIINATSYFQISTTPLVSIGVPVFNGEKGLSSALDSLLGQDYPNLEIIISDNGSTDATPEICRKYVHKDLRVRYYRSEENRGAIWNFNRVAELASGKYFMWTAHDDLRESSFVSACVDKMEQNPKAALCQSHVAMFIEKKPEVLSITHLDSFDGLTGGVAQYRETLKHCPATIVYGLYRMSVMRKTQMFKKSIATDIAFILELSIYGEFVQVPRVLFNYIIREKWNTIQQDYKAVLGKKKLWWYLPFVALFYNHWQRVACASVPFSIKLRLWGVLLKYETGQVALKVLLKVVGLFCPEKWKEKLGCKIYWRWKHNHNMEVVSSESHLYFERVIKPVLGWWK